MCHLAYYMIRAPLTKAGGNYQLYRLLQWLKCNIETVSILGRIIIKILFRCANIFLLLSKSSTPSTFEIENNRKKSHLIPSERSKQGRKCTVSNVVALVWTWSSCVLSLLAHCLHLLHSAFTIINSKPVFPIVYWNHF